jgi:triacylglycerol esterase/lipase EstA (alpha/beta hydrolase family)
MWTAISLWLIVGGGALAYVAWAVAQVGGGAPAWPFVVGLPLVYVALILFNTTIFFALAWWFRAQRPEHARIDGLRTMRMVWDEFRTMAGSAPRMMLYGLLVPDPAPAPAVLPVLLLHGVLCNAGVWTGMKRRLDAEGLGPVYALSYGPPLASIELFADQVAAKVDGILAATGARRVIIVGHSMGGLVARAYLRRHGSDRVARVVTIGTPHAGSVHAWMFPGVSLSQLRPGNAWLAELPGPDGGRALPPMVSLWSWHDSMVAPQTSSRLADGDNIELSGVGHNALLGDPEVLARVAEQIRRARAGAGAAKDR